MGQGQEWLGWLNLHVGWASFSGGKTLLGLKGMFPGMSGEASQWPSGLRTLLGCCDSCDGLSGQDEVSLIWLLLFSISSSASLWPLLLILPTTSSQSARSLMASTLQSSSTASASWLSSYTSTTGPTLGERGKSWLKGDQRAQRAESEECACSLLLVTCFQEENVSGEYVWGSRLAFKYPRLGRGKEWCKLRD